MKIRAAVLQAIGAQAPYAQSRPLRVQEVEVELDPPGPGEVLVRIGAAGLCHSDLSVISGDRPRPTPMVLGHESAGEVVEVAPDVRDLAPGNRVVLVFAGAMRRRPPRAVRAGGGGQHRWHAAVRRASVAHRRDATQPSHGCVLFCRVRGREQT